MNPAMMWSLSVPTISLLVLLIMVAFFSESVAVVVVTSYQFADIPIPTTSTSMLPSPSPSSSATTTKGLNLNLASCRRGRERDLSAGSKPDLLLRIRNRGVPRSVSFRRPAIWMVPRGGGDLETESGNLNLNLEATATITTAAAAEAAAVTSAEEQEERHSQSIGSILPSRTSFAMMVASPLAALRPVASLYCAALARHPIATNCATAAALSVVSDTIAQTLERGGSKEDDDHPVVAKKRQHDFVRSAWMALWGFVMSGWMIHYWFLFLNGLFPVEGLTLVGALKKVTVNQLVMSPGLNSLFFAFVTYARGGVVANVVDDNNNNGNNTKAAFLKRKLAADLLPTMKRSCVFWGTVQMVNFLLVPPRFAILFTNAGFLLWTTYISLVGYRTVSVSVASSQQ